MALGATLLPEFDQEMANTRKYLERVPEDRFEWAPHPKSYTLHHLAVHVATLPMWATETIRRDFIDLESGDADPRRTVRTRADLLAMFDEHVAGARAALAAASDECLLGPWSLKSGTRTWFTMPRIACLRSFVMNHLIHHRAQLGVYLRLNDVPVPGLYGPSADDKVPA